VDGRSSSALDGGGSDPAVIPDSISPAAGHGFFAVAHSN
jgi:hypothetical protein